MLPREASPGLIQVLIVDDHVVMRWGVVAVVDGSGLAQVVGEGSDGADAVRLVETLRPDVVVMDISMPHVDGLTATRRVLESWPGTGVVVLTAGLTPETTRAALAAGASAALSKGAPAAELLAAIQTAARR